MKTPEPSCLGGVTETIIQFLILNIPIFSRMKSDELHIIGKCLKKVDVLPDDTVFREGDRGDYVCFVVEGVLDVYKTSETGEEMLISTLEQGRSIGEMSIIDELPRSATVKARSRGTLLTLSKDRFDYIVSQHPAVGVKILKGIARLLSLNLRKTSSLLAD